MKKHMIHAIEIALFLAVGMAVYPPIAGQGKTIEMGKYMPPSGINPQKVHKFDSLTNVLQKDIRTVNAKVSKPKVKIIYRTKIRTAKPHEITLYVRQPDGTITEHKVKSDGGFYIVELDSLAKENIHIEFKEDSSKLSAPKKNFLQKLFKRRGQ